MFWNILDEKEFRQGIFFYIHCSRHIGLVPKGVPRHAFSQKSVFLGKTAPSCWHMYKTFLDVLDRKEAFLEIKNAWVFM